MGKVGCDIWEKWGGWAKLKNPGEIWIWMEEKKSRLLTECSASDHAVLMIHAVLISLAADRRKPLSTAAPSAPPPKKLAPQKLAPQKLAPQKLAPHGPTPWGDRVHLPS